MTARLRELRYVYGWRLRHWYLDTPAGARARVVALCVGVLVLVVQIVRMSIASLFPPPAGEPAMGAYWWVVQLVIAIVAAVVAYVMRPKPPEQTERKIEPPAVEDGASARDYGGTVWIEHDDQFLIGWKIVGRDAIRTKSGKK